ncbi:LemA family protein [Candidatus Uhrbacteria bacterium]|nr:LemA family protein [Candidatus Uhrbacteria bacterium]
MTPSLIFLIVVVLLILWLIVTYNGLIRSRTQTDEAFADIDVQLKRRHDLIPNLIAAVKGYAAHESNVFEKVTQARQAAIMAKTPQDKLATENVLAGTLKSLFAVSEAYPDLKANQNFLNLQDELSDTENKIQASRRFYNGNVRNFNTKLQTFPTNMIGNALGFKTREFFELADASERAVPEVKFV